MISKLPEDTTTIFTVMSKMAQSHNAINLAQGFPDFESDPKLRHLVSQAMKQGFNQYAPMPGDLGLRQQIAAKMEHLHHKKYDPETEITVTNGATQAIFTAIAAVIHPGDEAIIVTPAYDCYQPTVEIFGGTTVAVQLRPPFFKMDWDEVAAKITKKTKLIIINSPHNPTGTLFSKKDMEQLQKLVIPHSLYVISDEVYEHIVFDGQEHQSAARFKQLAERTFITASFGKTFHNTGWKIGYCAAPVALMTEFKKIHQYNVFSVHHPTQKALATYLETPSHYTGLSQLFQQKRDYFLHLLKESRFKMTPSQGTYFQLLDFSEISSESDIDFSERITKDFKVATIPTSVFNKNREDFKQVRVCFAKTEDTLKKAASILNTL